MYLWNHRFSIIPPHKDFDRFYRFIGFIDNDFINIHSDFIWPLGNKFTVLWDIFLEIMNIILIGGGQEDWNIGGPMKQKLMDWGTKMRQSGWCCQSKPNKLSSCYWVRPSLAVLMAEMPLGVQIH